VRWIQEQRLELLDLRVSRGRSVLAGEDLPRPTVKRRLVGRIDGILREAFPPQRCDAGAGLGDVGIAELDMGFALDREEVLMRQPGPACAGSGTTFGLRRQTGPILLQFRGDDGDPEMAVRRCLVFSDRQTSPWPTTAR
jgi:hypothetical protein